MRVVVDEVGRGGSSEGGIRGLFGALVAVNEVVDESLLFGVKGVGGDQGGVSDVECLDSAVCEKASLASYRKYPERLPCQSVE